MTATTTGTLRGESVVARCIFVIVIPGLPKATTEKALIENNVVQKNNRPNPFPLVCTNEEPENPPGCTVELEDDLQLLPSGTGILNVGGFDVTIRNNQVTNNGTVGVGVVQNPFLGMSSERTDLTWSRSGLALLACGVIILKGLPAVTGSAGAPGRAKPR